MRRAPRRSADAPRDALRQPLLSPPVVGLLVYLGLLFFSAVLLLVFTPPDRYAELLHAPQILGLSALDVVLLGNAGWALLFVLEFPLARDLPRVQRRVRRILAGCALAGLAVFEIALWSLAGALAG